MTSDQLLHGFCPHSRYTRTAPPSRRSIFPPNEFLQIIIPMLCHGHSITHQPSLWFIFIRRRTDPPAPHCGAKKGKGKGGANNGYQGEQATIQAPLANRKSPSYRWNPIHVIYPVYQCPGFIPQTSTSTAKMVSLKPGTPSFLDEELMRIMQHLEIPSGNLT